MKYFLVVFVTTLNAAFESRLVLEDKGFKSSSEKFNIPTPLQRTSKIHHVSSDENASFDPDPVTPHIMSSRRSHSRLAWCLLIYSSSEEDDTPTEVIPSPDSTSQLQYHVDAPQQPSSKCTLNTYVNLHEEEEEEDFQLVSLEDEHWNTEEILDRHLCIHEHSVPHELHTYPCPYLDYTSSYYDTLDISDIS